MLVTIPACYPHFRSAYVVLVKGSGAPEDPTQLILINCADRDAVVGERRFVSQAVAQQWHALRAAEATTAATRVSPLPSTSRAARAAPALVDSLPSTTPSSSSGGAHTAAAPRLHDRTPPPVLRMVSSLTGF